MSAAKRIKIVSDCTSRGTRIYDGDGNDISRYFNGVSWHVDVRTGVVAAFLFAPAVRLEVEGEVSPLADSTLMEMTALGDDWRRYAMPKLFTKEADPNDGQK